MAKLTEEHLKYLRNEEFLSQYALENKILFSNNKIEDDGIKIEEIYSDYKKLIDNLKVFRMFSEKIKNKYNLNQEEKITQEFIIKIADTINGHVDFISNGYRKIDTGVMFDGKYPIEESKNIEKKMEELLNNYYGPWSKLDVFEREARFNIEFLRIHPFEDGNGRTSRLLLNYNLLLQGHAPVILYPEIKKDYFDARNREDVEWIKELFEKESERELKELNGVIEENKEENERGYTL